MGEAACRMVPLDSENWMGWPCNVCGSLLAAATVAACGAAAPCKAEEEGAVASRAEGSARLKSKFSGMYRESSSRLHRRTPPLSSVAAVVRLVGKSTVTVDSCAPVGNCNCPGDVAEAVAVAVSWDWSSCRGRVVGLLLATVVTVEPACPAAVETTTLARLPEMTETGRPGWSWKPGGSPEVAEVMAETPGGREPADMGTAETTTTLGEDLAGPEVEATDPERGANSSPVKREHNALI